MVEGKKIAFLFPGQGAQYVGMGKDFCVYPESKKTFEEADDLLQENLSAIIWNGPEELLKETRNSQLAIFVVSCAILHHLQAEFPDLKPDVCAGLSLGEYTALYAAGKLSFKDALSLIQKRALFMDDACRSSKGAMSAVLGLEASVVEKVLANMNAPIWVANYNSSGQVVISGAVDAVLAAAGPLKEAGAKRVLPLQVHGAFHSPLMRPAQDKLEPYIRKTNLTDSPIKLVMNVPGGYASSNDMQNFLVQQVTSPVRWEQSILSMNKEKVDCYLEIGCGKTLTGLNRKIVPDALALSVDKVNDLEELHKHTLIAKM